LAYTAVESLSDSFKLVCYWTVWNFLLIYLSFYAVSIRG
jgi:hypothetical protein